MRIDIMCDLETLGKGDDTYVFQIAAAAFDIYTGEILDTFNWVCDIGSEKFTVDGSTLKWWLNTDAELLKSLIAQGKGTEQYMFELFHNWLIKLQNNGNNTVYFWGNGILFDNRIVKAKFEKYGMEYPIFYRKDRDLRTILDVVESKFGIDPKAECLDPSKPAHDAMNDVEYQIKIAYYYWNCINPMPIG